MISSVHQAPLNCLPQQDLRPFLRSLVEKSRLGNHPVFASVCYRTPYSDPLALLECLHHPNAPHSYFEKPTEEFSIACGGFLAKGEFIGNNRFHDAKIWTRSLFSRIEKAGDATLPGTGPTLFVNATFEASAQTGGPPPLMVFLPRWQVLNHRGEHFVVLNSKVLPDSDPDQLQSQLDQSLDAMVGLRFEHDSQRTGKPVSLDSPMESYDYLQGVRQALEHIRSGICSKIVLARQLQFRLRCELSPFSIAHDLRKRFPDCHSFSLSSPQEGIWVGASPETLASLRGNYLKTEALAGSAPRGHSAGKDAHWGNTLLAREKEVREHQIVIESIRRRLESIGVSSFSQGLPRLLRLANLQHVRTPVQGKIPLGSHPFDVLDALHPTPAMGGAPRGPALCKLAEIESAPRGWYSGVAGWMDGRGRSDFIVPIRCGKIQPDALTLYAGAGIVEGSIPEQEKSETDWKLQAMLEVITGSPKLPA